MVQIESFGGPKAWNDLPFSPDAYHGQLHEALASRFVKALVTTLTHVQRKSEKVYKRSVKQDIFFCLVSI